MSLKRGICGILGVLATLSLSGFLPGVALADDEPVDLLRTIPLEVSGYPAANCLSSKLTTANQVIQMLETTPVLLVHMEALRRGYADLPLIEQDKLLKALHKRHMAKENDLGLGFDLGYAELVYEHNKTGLFFLRKANDHFQDQFSNLAYGMAQVEADLTLENAKPEEMTTRKMDAMYRLGDAVKIDAVSHQPGFWPSYVRVIEKMKPMGAYKSFSRRDFSLAYVPYGSKVVPAIVNNNVTTSILAETMPGTTSPIPGTPTSTLTGVVNNSCAPEAGNTEANGFFGNMLSQRTATFGANRATIQFFPTSENHLYQARVIGNNGNPVLSFKTYAMPDVVEDVDGDGKLEIVARQYQYNPFKPVIVYRHTACGFELDKKISDDFQ